ncbi:MAG TPA: hypothetical protein DHV08_10650 [Rhodocyclaceae bacterium]|nr:MAG: hypothetical protein COW56_00220 [Rhodocyclales bacterium CG17_big_fil_post_rev_8_21_14_2_50_68_7]PIX75065.1 MAG: hypothetical protein COZ38_07600 [Rhodocyclales bacterium CG_4_10_14_3_um_filter_68_10]PJA56696.1 MAG: hypothetical protein CO164_11815 [Rhodocyclales bacterium CG_4_9_14_3_um_filter_68_10]HCX33960.1 hypothetical protein [Rhodocyclaceae bacterium]
MNGGAEPGASVCGRCGSSFVCGLRARSPCWCASLPALRRLPAGHEGCLCPNCLAELIAVQSCPAGVGQRG